MSTDEIIIRLFCMVDDRLGAVKKRSDARLYDSEIVTIGLLFALRGGQYRPFYRWLYANYRFLFPNLPDLTRLLRLLKRCGHCTDKFLAEPSLFTIADTYGIELCHPRREGRSNQQVGKRGSQTDAGLLGSNLAG
jgi:hypothetical protein